MTLRPCTRCQFRFDSTLMLYSKHHQLYYCIDPVECARRERNELTFEEIFELGSYATKEVERGSKRPASQGA